MPRPRTHVTAATVDAEIRRLMQERERLVVEEDRQRGAVVRAALGGPHAEALRAVLRRAIEARDGHLFGLAGGAGRDEAEAQRATRTTPARAPHTAAPAPVLP